MRWMIVASYEVMMDDNHDGAGDLLTKPDADKKDVHVLSLAWQS